MLASSAVGFTTPTPIQPGRSQEGRGARTEVHIRPVTMRFHAWLAVICCLIALQWLHWWTFLFALTLVASLGVRVFLVNLHESEGNTEV